MPKKIRAHKMKTSRAVKRRIHITNGGKGKLMSEQIGIRHGKTKLSSKKIRSKKGLRELSPGDARKVKHFLPYGGE